MPRILIFGNSGSGKTTMARELSREHGLIHLDLDSLAWGVPGVRASIQTSAHAIASFVAAHSDWVIEGCYGDLLELVVPHATELRFMNPGVETCVANCMARPWEPGKYPSAQAQNENLELLLGWVREYESRTDEYSLARHRAIFDGYVGAKREISGNRTQQDGRSK